ncbi:hypothetical protein JCM8547_007226 [Rhodosporidiobolus lusitaniae]
MLPTLQLPRTATRTLVRRFHSSPTSTMPAWSSWRLTPPTATPEQSITLAGQADLPRLPVPSLDTTLDRLERSAALLAETSQQRTQLEDKVAAFRKDGGVGKKLHEKLEKRREDPQNRSWLAQWWDEQAYMAYRDSVVVNVSYYYGFNRLPQSATNPSALADPAYVVASIAKTALDFRRLIASGQLEPDLAGRTPEQGVLCMESYKWAFNVCRVPAKGLDCAVKIAESDKEAQHFVVVKRNRFYSIPIVDEHGQEHGIEQLRQAVQKIVDKAEKEKEKAPPVGFLTGINRDHWAEAHSHLSSSSSNASTLRAIETAAFVICLDEASPEPSTESGIIEFSKRLWKGEDEGGNRFWDKPLQWVVFANGEAGFIGEHSCMDGTPTARLNDLLTKRLLSGTPPSYESSFSAAPSPKPLPFELDSTSLSHIADAETEFAEHIKPYDVHYTSYMRYGKDGIKKTGNSPDGWVQMLFQLAYYMTFNRPVATYEAAQTRRFQLGRTETVRILTPESLAFVQSFLSPSASSSEKLTLFHATLKAHGQDMKLASNGLGIDRHLFGLRMLAAELGEEERKEVALLDDPLVKESGTWRMSTSQIYIRNAPAYGCVRSSSFFSSKRRSLPTSFSSSYGWGPVVGDGLGLPYMIHPESLQLTVTCHHSVPGAAFLRNFEKAADALMDLHEQAAKEGQAKL